MTIKPELFREIAQALHGVECVRPMAVDLDMNPRNVQRWLANELDIPNSVALDLRRLIGDRISYLTGLTQKLVSTENEQSRDSRVE